MGIIHTAKKNLIPELVKKKTHLKKEEIARLEGKRRELTQKEEVEVGFLLSKTYFILFGEVIYH
jgi:hypothetical protein